MHINNNISLHKINIILYRYIWVIQTTLCNDTSMCSNHWCPVPLVLVHLFSFSFFQYHTILYLNILIFPSLVSCQGYGIGPVRVCVCVCVPVCQRSHDWTAWATDLKFGMDIAFVRSKVKVAILKNMISEHFYGVTCVECAEPFLLWLHVERHVTSCDVALWHQDVLWRHCVMSWHHFDAI